MAAAPARRTSAAAGTAIQRIAARLEPAVARAFLAAVEALKDRIPVAELALAAQRGRLTPQITAAVDRWPADLRQAVALVNEAFAKGGARAAAALRLSTAFDITNPFAVEAASQRTAFLVREITNETRNAIQAAIQRAFTDAMPPHVAARAIKPLIGLTSRQAQAVLTYRASLVAEGLNASTVDRLARKYAETSLRRRALVIARTETIRASTDGQLALWQQARADGLLPENVQKRWSATRDRRTCPTCASLDGQEVLLHEAFPGVGDGPPAHPQCRCSLVIARGSIPAQAAPRPRTILAQEADAYPVVNPAGVDTLARFTEPNGLLSPERQRLHDAIIEAELAKATPVARPVVHVMGGGPAAGKSTILPNVHLPSNALTIDVDHIRTLLPEYKLGLQRGDGNIASFTHEESSLIGKKLAAKASARGYNLVLDGTGDGSLEGLTRKLASYRAQGMPLHGHYVTVDTETAIARADARGQKTGRYVPHTFLREVHKGVSDVLPRAIDAGAFDTVDLWDTSTSPPIRVMTSVGQTVTVHDAAAWTRFLAKGRE